MIDSPYLVNKENTRPKKRTITPAWGTSIILWVCFAGCVSCACHCEGLAPGNRYTDTVEQRKQAAIVYGKCSTSKILVLNKSFDCLEALRKERYQIQQAVVQGQLHPALGLRPLLLQWLIVGCRALFQLLKLACLAWLSHICLSAFTVLSGGSSVSCALHLWLALRPPVSHFFWYCWRK